MVVRKNLALHIEYSLNYRCPRLAESFLGLLEGVGERLLLVVRWGREADAFILAGLDLLRLTTFARLLASSALFRPSSLSSSFAQRRLTCSQVESNMNLMKATCSPAARNSFARIPLLL